MESLKGKFFIAQDGVKGQKILYTFPYGGGTKGGCVKPGDVIRVTSESTEIDTPVCDTDKLLHKIAKSTLLDKRFFIMLDEVDAPIIKEQRDKMVLKLTDFLCKSYSMPQIDKARYIVDNLLHNSPVAMLLAFLRELEMARHDGRQLTIYEAGIVRAVTEEIITTIIS